ncbi:E4 ORF3 [Baboon adenovirus 3]|uniref:E4 ORF3 n=1 Tax=Simian mastadenovirus C TaxID=1962300 RepID=M9Z4L3_9ADEN|nr:E4 ORF3 [Baboon adenovirus 3]AGK27157.1 E4 ORF3 [Baboon adenovirus 3]AGK27229.1 E4 ORF3 [Simian mastadenovirus C]
MMVCLRMSIEGALVQLFQMRGVNLQELCCDIVREWRAENYLGMVQNCSVIIEDFEHDAFALLVFLDVRVQALLEAVVDHLENRIHFDLAVLYHQRTGGDRCHLRDLHFVTLRDRLE